jgi:hypothetical protein
MNYEQGFFCEIHAQEHQAHLCVSFSEEGVGNLKFL